MIKNNLLGQKFHHLLVIDFAPSVISGAAWKCLCDCGVETIVSSTHLLSGHTKSCGCLAKQNAHHLQYKNLIGLKYNLLTVIAQAPQTSKNHSWLCKCQCGKTITLKTYHLTQNRVYSCGCQSDPNKNRLTKQEKENLLDLYQNGASLEELAIKFNILPASINRIVRKAGIKKYQVLPTSKEDIEYIIQQYQNNISSEKIAQELELDPATVCRILKRNNISIRPHYENKRKFEIDQDFFKLIDTEEKAYILGFIYADGNVSKKGGDISIRIKDQDVDIVKKISNIFYGFDNVFYWQTKTTNACGIRICSKILKEDLINLGCMPNKTFLIRYPQNKIPADLVRHFIRGYFDGDGCVCIRYNKYSQRPVIDITSNLNFINDLANLLKHELGIDVRIAINKKNNLIGNFQSRSAEDAMKFLNWIYLNSKLYLDRKYNKYQEMIKYYQEKESQKETKLGNETRKRKIETIINK